MLHLYGVRKLTEGVCLKEKTCRDINVRRSRIPAFANDRIAVKYRPDGTATIVPIPDSGKSRVNEIVRRVFCIYCVEVAALMYGLIDW